MEGRILRVWIVWLRWKVYAVFCVSCLFISTDSLCSACLRHGVKGGPTNGAAPPLRLPPLKIPLLKPLLCVREVFMLRANVYEPGRQNRAYISYELRVSIRPSSFIYQSRCPYFLSLAVSSFGTKKRRRDFHKGGTLVHPFGSVPKARTA